MGEGEGRDGVGREGLGVDVRKRRRVGNGFVWGGEGEGKGV